MKSLANDKLGPFFAKAEACFKYMYLTLAILSFNNLTAGSGALKLLTVATAASGAVIVLYRLLHIKRYYKFYGIFLLILFEASCFISAVFNYKYGITENIQALVWMTFQFCILYATDVKSPREKEDKTYFGLLKLLTFYVALSNIASIIMLLTGFGRTKPQSFNGNLMGYLWGRLWGVYSDPNYGAVLCVATIMLSVYFIMRAKSKWAKAAYSFNILLSFLYIAFSDSRTASVCMIISFFVFVYLICDGSFSKFKGFGKQVVCLLLALCVSLGGIVMIKAIKTTYNSVSAFIYERNIQIEPGEEIQDESEEGPNIIERTGNELDEDISNRRFDLWFSGVEIWKTTPIFGTSHRNLMQYALDKLPDTYLVNNDKGTHFNTTHNVFIDLLVGQGVLGTAIFAVFMVIMIVLVCKKMVFTKDNTHRTLENIIAVSLVTVFAASGMFVLEVLYVNTPGAFAFWLSLGRLVKNLKYSEEK